MIMTTPFPPQEGIGYHVYNLSKELMRRGHNIIIIVPGRLNENRKETIESIEVFKVPFIPLYPFHINIFSYFLNDLFKLVEAKLDVVHIHSPLSPRVKTNLPVVSTIHTSLLEDARYIEIVDLKSLGIKVLTRVVCYPIVKDLMEHSKVVTTVSNSVAQELKKYYGLCNSVVVGNGVNEKEFTPIQKKKEGNYVLYVGRLSYRKGLFDLLECAKQIVRGQDVKFVIVGKGELEKTIKSKIIKHRLENKIMLIGHVNYKKLIEIYQNATIFLLPSHYEGLPTVLLEAMSCGLPVVATAIGGCLDVIRDGYNGLIVPPRSPEKMFRAITMLLDDRKLMKMLGDNARKTIEEKYTWGKITDRIEAIYRNLC